MTVLGSRKGQAVDSTGKAERNKASEFQQHGNRPRRIRNISPEQRGKGNSKWRKISSMEAQKKELSVLQTAHLHPPDNLDNDPLPTLWDLLGV